MKKKIVILGATGSIGKTLINILKENKNDFEILLLTANKNLNDLLKQVNLFNVKNIIITNYEEYILAKEKLKSKKINIYNNFNELDKIFKNKKIDYTMSAISGIEGLNPTLKIIKFTKEIAIANKEAIICGWSLINSSLKKYQTKFIPIDSEHFSIWSLLEDSKDKDIEKVFITASGGPFNKYPIKRFKTITIKKALKHPNWKMGKKISIDSATMINKVFEVIEAKKIFNFNYDKLEILVHPKSYVHAIVKFTNGLTKILIHETSMKIPIFNSLYPDFKKKINSKKLDFSIINNLDFQKVDKKRFPIVDIIKKMPSNDSLFETVLVSANDSLVSLFLNKKINFLDIEKNIKKIVNGVEFQKYRKIKPKNVTQIRKLHEYVSSIIKPLGV